MGLRSQSRRVGRVWAGNGGKQDRPLPLPRQALRFLMFLEVPEGFIDTRKAFIFILILLLMMYLI